MNSPLVIVTGGCGYIGSHTIIELIKMGFDVVSIDDLSRSTAYSLNCIKAVAGKEVLNHKINLTNLQDTRQVMGLYPNAVGVIHFAAFKSVPESVSDPILYYNNNIQSLVNVLSCIREYKIKSFVFSSSCSVYGDIAHLPVSEKTELSAPKSPYAYTKVIGEKIVQDASAAFGFNAINLRYFNPVGAHLSAMMGELPLQKPDNLLPIIMQTGAGRIEQFTVFGGNLATRDGSCIRDYVHVVDIAKAHILSLNFMMNKEHVYDIINLGTGNGVSVFEAIKEFEDVTNLKLNYTVGAPRPGDVIEIFSDTSKAKSILGWKAEYNLKDMIQSAWNWQLYLEKNYYN